MNRATIITRVSLCVAMLIGAQLALGSVAGIEIVSVLLVSFSFSFGVSTSLLIATTFSLLRCLIFGSYINVICLYLIYYNLLSLCFAHLGKRFKKQTGLKQIAIVTALSVLFTVFFTLLDDVLTPLFYGFTKAATVSYFYASLYTAFTHTLCVGVSVSVLFKPLTRVLLKIKVFK